MTFRLVEIAARFLLVALLALGCGSAGQSKRTAPDLDVSARLAEMCATMPQYVAPYDGDSATFTAYSRAACGGSDINEYESRPGRYERWPLELGYKWDDLNSTGEKTRARSENSKDMYLAVITLAWANQDRATLESIRNFGQSRDWFMGDGRYRGADTILSLGLRQTLAEMIYQLGGANHGDRYVPVVWSACNDYECWNMAVHLALRLDLYGRIGGTGIRALEKASALQPANPLVVAVLDRANGLGPHRALKRLRERFSPPAGDKCDLWPYRRNDLRPLCQDGWPGDWAFAAKYVLEGVKPQSGVPNK